MKKKEIKKECDKLWAELVKLKAGNKCEHCGKKSHLNSHHFFGRRALCLRHDPQNGVSLCVGCHKFSTVFSAHETPSLFDNWIIGERGGEWYDYLLKKHRGMQKVDYEETRALLKGEIAKYGTNKQ